jgi:hypothetical protein
MSYINGSSKLFEGMSYVCVTEKGNNIMFIKKSTEE